MPRSLPRLRDSALRAAKPAQSAAFMPAAMVVAKSPES